MKMQERGEPVAAAGMSRRWLALAGLVSLLSAAGVSWAAPPGSDLAREALRLCHAADVQGEDEQEELLARGMDLAEAACAADDDDAAAHFALFCNLAKRVRREGIGPFTLRDLARARGELDRALALAPRDPDLLTAKGALLLSLPGLLGGNPHQAYLLLLQAFVAAPDNRATRSYLEHAVE